MILATTILLAVVLPALALAILIMCDKMDRAERAHTAARTRSDALRDQAKADRVALLLSLGRYADGSPIRGR